MDALLDEVESLEAILMDDVRISRNAQTDIPEVIETTVFPLVDDESEQQYVCVTLQVLPQPGYPDVSPDFKLLRPRGLDDARLNEIKAACVAKLEDSVGFPVVFDLIEVVREHLSGSNLPSGQCVICLYGFSDGDEFTRTECFHYLHSYCLARHLNALRRNYQEEHDKLPAWLQKTAEPFLAACPVCREPIKDEAESLKCAMPPAELQNAPDFKLTRELRELQQRMSNLFLQQKSRGGIIDVEAESGSVISIETEEEIRRRLQRKQRDESSANTSAAADNNSCNNSTVRGLTDGGACDTHETGSNLCTAAEQKETAPCKPSSSNSSAGGGGTNFAPVVQQTQRISSEPTNNNYQHQSQHNRRHYRGGRRHQNHHHHHHRDRYEHNQHGNGAAGGAAANVAAPTTATAAANSAGGKQTKAHAAGAAHAR